MGSFYTTAALLNPLDRVRRIEVAHVLIDTGSECTWIRRNLLEDIGLRPENKSKSFHVADGRAITRPICFAIIEVEGEATIDEVVMAEPGDLQLLGARTLEGLNLRVDPIRKCLMNAGPAPAACA